MLPRGFTLRVMAAAARRSSAAARSAVEMKASNTSSGCSGATETLEAGPEREMLAGAVEEAGAAVGLRGGHMRGGRTGGALTGPYVLVSCTVAAGRTAALGSAGKAFAAGVLGYMTI